MITQKAIECTVIATTSIIVAFHSLQAFPLSITLSPALPLLLLTITSIAIEYYCYDKNNTTHTDKQKILLLYDVYTRQQRHTPTLSSGISLGILTLPWVATSLASRSFISDEQEGADMMIIPCISMYCAFAGSASILTFLFYLFSMKNAHILKRTRIIATNILLLLFIGYCALSYFLILNTTNNNNNSLISSSQLPSSVVGILLYSLSSILAFHCFTIYIPRTFTLGEGILISQGLVQFTCYIGILFVYILRNGFVLFDVYRNFVAVVIFAAWIIACVSSIIITIILKNNSISTMMNSVLLGICVCCLVAIAGVGMKLALWVLDFIVQDSNRLLVIGLWVLLLMVSLPLMLIISKSGRVRNIIVRKGYHALASAIFAPALFLQPQLLGMAASIAFLALILVEILRLSNITRISSSIHTFMSSFIDARDSGCFYITHFTLLLGLSLPVWLSNAMDENVHINQIMITPLNASSSSLVWPAALAGVIITGVSDAVASIVGSGRYGTARIAVDSKKTVQGTGSGIIAALIVWWVVVWLTGMQVEWWVVCYSTVLSGLLEASTEQLDNLVIPLHYFALLLLV